MSQYIRIENARQNNLRNLDLKLPHGELIVITGVSGSGKSTLAFDTVYAEGQRRYVETFSPYARQFLDRMDKPQVGRIDGIPPAIAIDQTNPVRTSRSTVGTMTELNDHIKLLFARCAALYCGTCGEPVRRDTAESVAAHYISAEGSASTRVMVTFNVDVPENFTLQEIESWLTRQGYTRVHARNGHTLDVIQDRLKCSVGNRARLTEAIETALHYGQGKITVHVLDDEHRPSASKVWSTAFSCEHCDKAYRPALPSSFSFNSPIGACETCRGFGRVMGIDYRLAIPDETKTLSEGAVKAFQTNTASLCQNDMERAARQQGIPLDLPFASLAETHRRWVIEGDGGSGKHHWYGVAGFFRWLEGRAYKMHVRVLLSKYRSYDECPDCRGARLKPDSLLWRIGSIADAEAVTALDSRHRPVGCQLDGQRLDTLPGLNIVDLVRLPLAKTLVFIERLARQPSDDATRLIVDEMRTRLTYLNDVGLGYLALDRQSRTLSGGEVQRINLTTALGTSLVNTLFVLDEPSIGLHARDMDRMIRVLKRLRDAGNTLLVVEHDPQVMLAADRIIDMGPGPGLHGGSVMFNGKPARLCKSRRSLTAAYLRGDRRLAFRPAQPTQHDHPTLQLSGATGHNLQAIELHVPHNRLVCITGPSGSGKSTLVHDTLYLALLTRLGKPKDMPQPFAQLDGVDVFEDVIMVDQSPIGKSARSNPVSYTGAFDTIRKLFEKIPEARQRGYTASAFSFNSGMRCPVCSGNGFEHVEMQFLSDVYLRCAECQGRRYRPELLEVKLFQPGEPDARSVADVLDMTVDRALEFFRHETAVCEALKPLADVGLGYLTLGQPVPTLSGGEAQRLKLAAHLGQAAIGARRRGGKGQLLFLFDEPTTGLHFEDIGKLLSAFEQLLEQGHSLVVVEHNLDVITNADWIVDLGPDGGEQGGRIVCAGNPSELIAHPESITGKALAAFAEASDRLRRDSRLEVREGVDAADTRLPRTARSRDASKAIVIRHAREHNLKNIDVHIPRDRLTVITGMSGSGKSTLAFDILFNEGQRRYLESLNAYARQFVQPAARPDVDAIAGIPPTVAIEQRTSRGGRKSTVATMTEIYHFLRLLFVKLGVQYCPDCEVPISAQTVEAITAQVLKCHRDRRIQLHAPLVVGRKGYYTELARWAANKGYVTLRVDGDSLPTDAWPRLDRFREHDIDLPVASIQASAATESELRLLIRRGLDFGSGMVRIGSSVANETLFSVQRACPECLRSFPELDPRMFSYNSRHGWCPDCFGTGELITGFDAEQTGEERNWRRAAEESTRCPSCQGLRLKPDSLAVYLKDWSIADYTALTISEAAQEFSRLDFTAREHAIARDSLAELNTRLHFLNAVGLDYLSLDRAAPTLSGGEAQRIRLAAQLGSNLRGVCYILDEPTIGLHPRDNALLLDTLDALRRKGNTIVVVEHDEDTIRRAGHVIDIGPGAGVRGGEVVASGSVGEIRRHPTSVTGRMLRQPLAHPLYRPRGQSHQTLDITGARLNNLRAVNVAIPLGRLVGVSGVSGSGKSTLVRSVIYANLKCINGKGRKKSLGPLRGVTSIEGWRHIDRVLEVDQTPIGKTPRSCPATYIGFWDTIRRLFADTTEARIRGYKANRFSFNVSGGRCAQCEGQGMQRVEMNFLPDVKVTCEVCGGARFNSETLSIRYREHSIGDVLAMNVDDAVDFFANHANLEHPLTLLRDMGLGYLTLGQQSPTLSGGEAQRIKLVSELARARPTARSGSGKTVRGTHTLYVLDEPTVGLHMADVERLIRVLHRLVDAGNSVIVIEHNLDLLAEADWIIDMGPEGGNGGGRIVMRGTPMQVGRSKRSRTAPHLRAVLERTVKG